MIKKFTELFGEAIEKENCYIALSADRNVALVENIFFDEAFKRYIVRDMPKLDERFEVVRKDGLFFNLKIIRTILNDFMESNSFDACIVTFENDLHAFVINLNNYCIMFGEMVTKHETIIEKYETIYNWNDIFNISTIGDDMVI